MCPYLNLIKSNFTLHNIIKTPYPTGGIHVIPSPGGRHLPCQMSNSKVNKLPRTHYKYPFEETNITLDGRVNSIDASLNRSTYHVDQVKILETKY